MLICVLVWRVRKGERGKGKGERGKGKGERGFNSNF